jgi:hypothetical protein
MSDRVVMMTNGPNARVGQVLELPFERPRLRTDVLEDSMYYELRGCLVSFLEQQELHKKARGDATSYDNTEHMIEAITDTRYDLPAYEPNGPLVGVIADAYADAGRSSLVEK